MAVDGSVVSSHPLDGMARAAENGVDGRENGIGLDGLPKMTFLIVMR